MFAVTQRLLLRPGWAEDASALSHAIGEHAVVRNLARAPWPYALGDAERFLALPREANRPHFLVFRRDGAAPELVGGVGLVDGREPGAVELGYWVARAHWGQGLATEATRAVLAIADQALRLPRLVASHMVDNPASGRVLAKLGFRPAGRGLLHSTGRGGEVEINLLARDRAGAVEGVQLAA